jgi:hypothetical protein
MSSDIAALAIGAVNCSAPERGAATISMQAIDRLASSFGRIGTVTADVLKESLTGTVGAADYATHYKRGSSPDRDYQRPPTYAWRPYAYTAMGLHVYFSQDLLTAVDVSSRRDTHALSLF